MKTYRERLNNITQEFVMFAGFAAMEERFRALNNNDRPDDNVDSTSYGLATAGLVVCTLRLAYHVSDFVYAAGTDAMSYFRRNPNNHQPLIQVDPFDQLDTDVQRARGAHQTVVDGNRTLREENAHLRRENAQYKKDVTNLKQDIAQLKHSQPQQNSGSIQTFKQ